MLREEKKNFVAELEGIYKTSNSIIITHYHGLTVSEVTELRQTLRKNGAFFKVIKNTLSKIAVNNLQLDYDPELFSGPTAIAYSDDPVAAAKGVVEFTKSNDNLKVIAGIVNNQVLDVGKVKDLSKLPSLDELRGKIVGLLQAPATNIARVVNAPASQLARVIQAYADKG
ncbi:MAG: 50S ribosomal protein L10 [Rickettsiaceae bacterium]|nr:50S ribosomal protein L10 [Rickettsiaceae bacterium]